LDISAVDRILILVNLHLHWVLALVDVEHRRFVFYDSLCGKAAVVLGTVRR